MIQHGNASMNDMTAQGVNSLLDAFMRLAAAPNGEVSKLRKLTDGANEIIRGLDAVRDTSRDCWVIHLVLAKIDPDSRRKWIEDTRGVAVPTVTDLFKFLDNDCEDFELSQATSAIKANRSLITVSVAIAVSVAPLTISCEDAPSFKVRTPNSVAPL